ncbi:MAG: hypothetical protein WC931_02230 [Bacilli bacterium]
MTKRRKEYPRSPNNKVKELLRKEVNYGCPVPGCGLPFLTWHHFDPPWRERQHQDPAGIVALCPGHAAWADGGAYTKEQLQHFKRNPFVKDRLTAEWPWQPEKMMVSMGRMYFLGTKPIISFGGSPIISIGKRPTDCNSSRLISIGIHLRDPGGKTLLRVKDNMLDYPILAGSSLEFPPQARSFAVKHESGVCLNLAHDLLSLDDIEKELNSCSLFSIRTLEELRQSATNSDGLVSIMRVEGVLRSASVTIESTRDSCVTTLHFYNNERCVERPRLFLPGGSLSVTMSGEKHSILSFG